jgi:DNA-binding helix-hairpin-helix protein with protein kinase domain
VFNFVGSLVILFQIARTLAEVHRAGFIHGDVHLRNARVEEAGDVLVTRLIDWDNACGPRMDPPPALGAPTYLAPEMIAAQQSGRGYQPDIGTERYAFSCLAHWGILQRPNLASYHEKPDDYVRRVMRGEWDSDPASGPVDVKRLGGIPNEVVSAPLAQLFRRGLAAGPTSRPSLDEWAAALLQAIDEVFICPFPDCQGPNLVDLSKQRCPHCRRAYPILKLVFSDRTIAIDRAAIPIGRDELKSTYVSERQAVLRRLGPETWIECIGKNPTCRLFGRNWKPLQNGRRLPLAAGDRLRFADIEAKIVA